MSNQNMETEETYYSNYGPQGGLASGPLKLKMTLSGERVVAAEPDVGFLHRGIEKTCEKLQWVALPSLIEKVDYLSSIHGTLALSLAVEKLMKIEISPRAQAIRLIVSELNRIASHIYFLTTMAKACGAQTASQFFLRDREKINNLFEMLTGARLMYNYVCVGGVMSDITEGFIEKTHDTIKYLKPKLKEYDDLLFNNHIFTNRLKKTGILKTSDCISHYITGPNARASGFFYDVRALSPYCGYEKYKEFLERSIKPVTQSDSLDRLQQRVLEIRQSLEILSLEIDRVPAGTYKEKLSKDGKVPKGEAYSVVESSRGLFGVYVCSSGGNVAERIKLRTPSLSLLKVVPDILKGNEVSDVPGVIASLDISVSEIDR